MTSRVAHPFSTSRESLAASHLGNSEITRDCTGSFLQLLLLIIMQLLIPIILPYLLKQVRKRF